MYNPRPLSNHAQPGEAFVVPRVEPERASLPVASMAEPPTANGVSVTDEPTVQQGVSDLNTSLSVVLDQLQTALAKLGGADAPSQQYGDPAAGRALALIAAGVEAPDEVHMETRALHEHLNRLFSLFSAAGNSSKQASEGTSGARMTALGFRKLVRAAQLTSDRCTDVDVDLIFQQVVRTRGARMSVGDMMVGLSMVAKRIYSQERTQSAAFHRLLSEQLLPWMLQYAPLHAPFCVPWPLRTASASAFSAFSRAAVAQQRDARVLMPFRSRPIGQLADDELRFLRMGLLCDAHL